MDEYDRRTNSSGVGFSGGSEEYLRPTAPSNLAVTYPGLAGRLNLTWTDNSDNETGFKVYRNGVLLATLAADTTSYASTGNVNFVTYSFQVAAYNSIGSSYSNTATGMVNPE